MQVVSPEAYLLFYVKKSIRHFHRQSVNIPEYWPFLQDLKKQSARSLLQADGKPGQDTPTTRRNSVYMLQVPRELAVPDAGSLLAVPEQERTPSSFKKLNKQVSGSLNNFETLDLQADQKVTMEPPPEDPKLEPR